MLPHWTQQDIQVNGVQLHYYRTGKGDKRPLILVHGFSDNGLCWTPVARALEADYDVIMPDMRAHGLSQRVQPNDHVDMAADLAELIRALGLERPIVCGHSMGSLVTFQLGVRFPELASALILEDPPRWINRPEPAPHPGAPAENPMAKWAKSLASRELEDLLVEYRKEHPTWPEELLVPMCQAKKQLDATITDIMSPKIHAQEVNWLTALPKMTHPMLVFAGNPDLGGIVTPEVVAKVRELNPKVQLVVIPDVGHLIRFDQYDIFMEKLHAFLEQLPA